MLFIYRHAQSRTKKTGSINNLGDNFAPFKRLQASVSSVDGVFGANKYVFLSTPVGSSIQGKDDSNGKALLGAAVDR
jgi:hypothetical protein